MGKKKKNGPRAALGALLLALPFLVLGLVDLVGEMFLVLSVCNDARFRYSTKTTAIA